MNDDGYYAARDERLLRYPEARRLDQSRWIAIRATPEYVSTYSGQVAALTAANLFGRMLRAIALDIPSVAMVEPLPWAGENLGAFALAQMQASDPRGDFRMRAAIEGDYIVHLGRSGSRFVTHGTGWLAYVGPSPSPLVEDSSLNPVGPALAVIVSAARLFVHAFEPPAVTLGLNTFNWSHDLAGGALPALPRDLDLGSAWTVGTGSVGTAILYFLALATREFSSVLFDGDQVMRENITRSPIFADTDIDHAKVEVTAAYLKSCGIAQVVAEPVALHDSRTWERRAAGTPDLVIAAANEHNVRHYIESLYPPIQIYGTTGQNWQAAVIRHIPMRDPCSCCLFPETAYAPTQCATDAQAAASKEPHVDASLPFLSFVAGLMTAAEILKLRVPGYPFTPNRAFFSTRPEPRFVAAGAVRREGCVCGARSRTVHAQMIGGSRYASLSDSSP